MLPIKHLSYSSLTCYLKNPYQFWRRYVAYVDDSLYGPAALVGVAFHKCLECYYSGLTIEQSVLVGENVIFNQQNFTEWGKTGSYEHAVKDYRQTVSHYFADPDNVFGLHQILGTEVDMFTKIEGVDIQLKVIADALVWEGSASNPKEHIDIYDWKKVTSLSKPDEDEIKEAAKKDDLAHVPASYWIQAAFNFWGVSGTMRPPRRMVFREVKTSKNKDGSAQVFDIILNFNDPRVIYKIECVKILVNKVLRDMDRLDREWLPNISDQMDGDVTWKNWLEGLMAPGSTPAAV